MKIVGIFGLACIFTFASLASARCGTTMAVSDLIGSWVVTSQICDHCGVYSGADDGQTIRIDEHAYHDPYNLNCQAGAKYVLQSISEPDAQRDLAVPRSIYALPATGITLARLECPVSVGNAAPVAIQSADILLLGHDKAIYLWNGGVNFLMHRKPD
ncbi:MAG: hypothetical protein B7Z78_05645 [Rhodospirillales bacterium 20-60-12]|jgi:hypothetical protein|nr:MAG: hypothetical protein B7Z78_05645 [Rhodospirillales bacterium 20-60-12]